MKYFKIYICLAMLFFSNVASAEKITIAAAADLKFAMTEVVAEFQKSNPVDEVALVFGSSGKFSTQIQQGAPFDLYFSADISYPMMLYKNGYAASAVKPYALGRIVLWSTVMDATKMTLASLTEENIKHVAIANPSHAPYGKRAEEALQNSGMLNKVKSKLVFGDNIAHTAEFVESGNAQVGIIALSLAMNPELSKKGGYWLIPDNLHEPLEQGFIITKRAKNNLLAKRFSDFMNGKKSREIMKKYGFLLRGENASN